MVAALLNGMKTSALIVELVELQIVKLIIFLNIPTIMQWIVLGYV
jgi:hypothetical protein